VTICALRLLHCKKVLANADDIDIIRTFGLHKHNKKDRIAVCVERGLKVISLGGITLPSKKGEV
jgi:hypothetical protein